MIVVGWTRGEGTGIAEGPRRIGIGSHGSGRMEWGKQGQPQTASLDTNRSSAPACPLASEKAAGERGKGVRVFRGHPVPVVWLLHLR